MNSSKAHYLPKAPFPNAILWAVRASTDEFGGGGGRNDA